MGGFLLDKRGLLQCLRLLTIVGLSTLSGCGRFFVSQSTTTTTTTNTTAGDVLYVAATVGENVSAYTVSTAGALTAVSGSPYSLGTPPLSMAITPGNTFLYVGEAAGIVGYSVGTGGVLTQVSSGAALASDVLGPLSMQVDTTGGFLMAAGINLTAGTPEIGIYQIDATAGTLTAVTGSPLAVVAGNGATSATPTQLYIAPNNQDVYLTLGEGGTEILTFDANGEALSDTKTNINLSAKGVSQTGVIANAASSLLFVSETTSSGGVVRVLTIGSNGSLTEITGSPFAVGNGPDGMVLNGTGTNLYVANKGDNTISGLAVASTGTVGTLTTLSGSPYAVGSLPLSLSLDQSKDFLAVANSGGTPDLGINSFDATTAGKLDALAGETASTPAGAFLVLSTH